MLTLWFSFSCNLFLSFSWGETIDVKINKFHIDCIKWDYPRLCNRMEMLFLLQNWGWIEIPNHATIPPNSAVLSLNVRLWILNNAHYFINSSPNQNQPTSRLCFFLSHVQSGRQQRGVKTVGSDLTQMMVLCSARKICQNPAACRFSCHQFLKDGIVTEPTGHT